MRHHLRGPGPCTAVLFLLLVAAHGWKGAGAAPGAADAGGSYPVADLLVRLTDGAPAGEFGSANLLVALALLAVAGGTFFALLLAWTGNRIVSALSAALFVLHPAARSILLGPDAVTHAAAAVFVLGTLAARERGWAAWREGRAPLRYEVLALGVFFAAALSGPGALAVPLLIVLTESTFHVREPAGQRREGLAVAALYAAVVMAVWLINRPSSGTWGGEGPDLPSRISALVLVRTSGTPAAVLALLVAAAGLVAFGLGRRSLGRHPRWVLLYAGFGIVWSLVCEVPNLIGLVPRGAQGQLLPLAGPALILPALAWRVLLGMLPEPGTSGAGVPPPLLDAAAMAAVRPPPVAPSARSPRREALRRSRPGPASGPAGVAPLSPPEIREAVETAVDAAVESAVAAACRAAGASGGGTVPPGRPPGARYAEEWNRYEQAWAKEVAGGARKILGEEWSDVALDRNLFDNYCRPWLSPRSRVLEIGQGGGKFTAMIAPEVSHVICVDVSANMLQRARRDLGAHHNVSFVLTDGRGLAPLAPGSIDFAFAYDVFVHLDQEDIFLYLQDLARALRPGGRAVISFANLLDPLGFRQFQRDAAQHRTGRRSPGRINFLSPEIVRTLTSAAGLAVESVHLAANNRDFVAVLERRP